MSKKRPKDLQLQTNTSAERKNTVQATGGSNKPCPNAEWAQSGSYVVGDLRIKDCGVKREVASPCGEAGSTKGTPDSVEATKQAATTDATSGIKPEELETEKVLGRGASGTVMLVRHKGTNVQYAVKVINLGAGGGGGANAVDPRMVLQEVNTMEHTSPFLVRAFTAFLREKNLHIVQEYMDKGSLDDVIRNYKKGVPENVLAIIASQLIQGLAHLHSGGSSSSGGNSSASSPLSASGANASPVNAKKSKLHRDLKPANILACSQGLIKISDFGIATTAGSCGNSTMVGTTTYMSPERIRGERYNISSDIWAAGLVLCELCLGHYPYKNCATFFMLLKEITKPQEFEFPPDTSDACKDFINCCMKQKPEERWTADALLQHTFIASVKSEGPSEPLAQWLGTIPMEDSSGST